MHVLRHHDVPHPANAQLRARTGHAIHEDPLDLIVAEELQPTRAGDRQEMNVTVHIASAKLAGHWLSLSDIVSVPHPSPEAKDGAPAPRFGTIPEREGRRDTAYVRP